MKTYFSPSTSGFYADAIHGGNIPADGVEITAERHAELLDGQASGKVIRASDDGQPLLLDPALPSAPQLAAVARARRDALIRGCDWTQLSDSPLAEDQRSAWALYRAALRQVPDQPGFPTFITWPEAPQ
jgi:hypothetical protein